MMIAGTVANREALVELEVSHAGQSLATTAAIDTGYNGYLTLPSNLITALGLPFAGYRSGTLADGSTVVLDVYFGNSDLARSSERGVGPSGDRQTANRNVVATWKSVDD